MQGQSFSGWIKALKFSFIRSIFRNHQAGLSAGFLEAQDQVETLGNLSGRQGQLGQKSMELTEQPVGLGIEKSVPKPGLWEWRKGAEKPVLGGRCPRNNKCLGTFSLGVHLFDLEVSRATTGTSKHPLACRLQERILQELCLLVSALPGAGWISSGKPLAPSQDQTTHLS